MNAVAEDNPVLALEHFKSVAVAEGIYRMAQLMGLVTFKESTTTLTELGKEKLELCRPLLSISESS